MTKHTPISGAVTGLPEGAIERLALFAEWTGTTPPACIVIGEGKGRTFSDDILIYADRQGMSLDWFWLGDERSLVMANHNRERRT